MCMGASSGAAYPPRISTAVAAGHHLLRRALDDQQPPAGLLGQRRDRSAARNRTARRRCRRQPASSRSSGASENRLVERALHPPSRTGCSRPPARARARYSAPSMPGWPTSAMRASVSVPVLSVHSTSIAPRSWIDGEPLHHHLARRHAQRAARQRHGHDHRQQLRREPDRQRDREQERFQHRPPEGEMRSSTSSTRKAGQPQDEDAERVQAALERTWAAGTFRERRRCRRSAYVRRSRRPAWSHCRSPARFRRTAR